MEIRVFVSCIQEDCGRSECSLLLESLMHYRAKVEQDDDNYGDATEGVIRLLDSVAQSVHAAMLNALEGLEPFQQPDGKGGYKTVYEPRATVEEDRSE